MTPEEQAIADAAAAAALRVPARQQHERSAAHLNIDKFQSNVDDIEIFLELFENSVELATGVEDPARKGYLCRRWLPLKLDDAALATFKQAQKTDWHELKEELIGLLVDPQEKYKWQAKLTTIKWDGKESFHTLASRVKRAVNKFDKEMPQEFKDREYFFRFRAAFKKPMRRFIDMGCPANKRTIDHAKEVALRYQLTLCDEDEGANDEQDSLGAVGFAGATLREGKVTTFETALAGIATQMENLAVTLRSFDDRLRVLERECSGDRNGNHYNPGGHHDSGQNRSRSHRYERHNGWNDHYDDPDDRHDRRNERRDGRSNGRERQNRNDRYRETESEDDSSDESVPEEQPRASSRRGY